MWPKHKRGATRCETQQEPAAKKRPAGRDRKSQGTAWRTSLASTVERRASVRSCSIPRAGPKARTPAPIRRDSRRRAGPSRTPRIGGALGRSGARRGRGRRRLRRSDHRAVRGHHLLLGGSARRAWHSAAARDDLDGCALRSGSRRVAASGDPALRINSDGRGPVSAEWMIPKSLWMKRNSRSCSSARRACANTRTTSTSALPVAGSHR